MKYDALTQWLSSSQEGKKALKSFKKEAVEKRQQDYGNEKRGDGPFNSQGGEWE